MIKITNLNKRFGHKEVIKNMNFEIRPGTIFGLIGINGAGKSTLLRLLSGVLTPETGDIFLDDISIHRHPEIKKNLFYLSDNPPYASFTTLSDMKQIYKPFYDFDDAVFDEILKLFSLNEKEVISKFSKGMRRQGYLALAFASGAKYLLFDEVFDGLDPQARLKFKQYMIKHQRDEQIIVITSHSLRELEDICDSFGMIDDGHFKKFGQIDFELNKVRKFQIILKDIRSPYLKEKLNYIYEKKDNRVMTLIVENLAGHIDDYLLASNILAADELPITFEEFFIISQGGEQ